MKKITAIILCLSLMFIFTSCNSNTAENTSTTETEKTKKTDVQAITLDENSASLNGTTIKEYDYTWNYDPAHEEPYFTGTAPSETDGVYIAHDIIYYPEIDENAFTLQNYDGENEWVTHFTSKKLTDYIFSTLPSLGRELPTSMMHSAKDAYDNPVLHITKAGNYVLSGSWNGQIKVDLGDKDETFTDENAKVVITLNNADITCTVAPAVLFYSAYECDNEWESREEYGNDVDLTNAGVKVILADGSKNNVVGANVFRLLKPEYKKDSTSVQKKLYKTDGAFYSYVSMLISGEQNNTGILNITSTTYEGLDSELHLTIDGGYINIVSEDDGINVNEDDVSVFTMNDGHLVIFAGQGAEGDVVDSNGYITVNGGFIAGATPSVADDILDCDCEKKVSNMATIVENKSSNAGAGMPMGGGPGGEKPAEPPTGEMQPPDMTQNEIK